MSYRKSTLRFHEIPPKIPIAEKHRKREEDAEEEEGG